MTGGAHDTLRDEQRLLDEMDEAILDQVATGHLPARPMEVILPAVRRYAAAQVAAERERIAAAIEAEEAVTKGRDRVLIQSGLRIAAHIARGQP